MEKRIFENPLIKDKVTLLETSRETNGAYTFVEVELLPGGKNEAHYHTAFSEEFIPVEGNLGITTNKKNTVLKPGQKIKISPGQVHNFYNPENRSIRFRAKLIPGHEGFENGLKIAYGLASDNKTNKKGIPSDINHLAILMKFMDTGIPGILSFLRPFFVWQAKRAIKKGIDKELMEKYG
jgi:quercetin dioxygenase-like cupin family protein